MVEWLKRNRSNLAIMLVVLVAVAAFTLLQLPRRPALQVITPSASPIPASIKVHVVGSVATPGVYTLAADARVGDALNAAGGPVEAADLASLNLATPLRDGQQVAVPAVDATSQAGFPPVAGAQPDSAQSLGAKPSPIATSRPSSLTPVAGKLDLNTATRAQLEDLPGIGPVTSQKILDYRAKNGRVASVEELKGAKLVNAPTYEKVKEMVEVR